MIYDIAGVEPTLDEIVQDPIFRHLRHYDGLPPSEWPELEALTSEHHRRAA
jgi:hypothetical protein